MSLNAIFTGLNGISSLAGMLGGDDAVTQAKKAQQAAINQYQQSGDQQYQDLVGGQNRNLYSQAGTAGDAIRSLGSRLGSSLAGAGVYNSSATAGALAQGQQNSDAALAELGARYDLNARNLRDQNAQNVANMQYGFAKQNYGQALNQQAAGSQGFQSWLGSLGT